MPAQFYRSTEAYLRDVTTADFRDETILLKGARPFGFEQIGKFLQQKAHETVLEINLDALVHNLNYYRSRLRGSTKIMAMVKAASYGSGSYEIANTLQFHHVDWLAVAYTDEGVELRKAGIGLPIMVMNPEVQNFEAMLRYRLEPETYSFRLLGQLVDMLRKHDGDPFRIHVKLDTGMHRLGFEEKDIHELAVRLRNHRNIRVQSVFTHLVASDESEHDGFTRLQFERFERMSAVLEEALPQPFLRHALNSSGIFRFNEVQYDMVRLGIGLYGIASTSHEQQQLQQVATLRTTVSQIKQAVQMLTKCLVPLPVPKEETDERGNRIIHDQFADKELRYRQRYLDLAVNPQERDTFRKRAKIITTMRRYLDQRGYLEVETPVLHTMYGGEAARPFSTHLNALSIPLYLRISLELNLKRLIVGGLEGVYDLGKNFRNEGIDKTHNPEFTMLELYVAYKDYLWMLELVEEMLNEVVLAVNGSLHVKRASGELNFTRPFRRATMHELIYEYTGHRIDGMDADALRNVANQLHTETCGSVGGMKGVVEILRSRDGDDQASERIYREARS